MRGSSLEATAVGVVMANAGPNQDMAAAVTEPSSSEILSQLDKILSSQEFALPERGRKFLRYVVEETLAGGAERIKGYSVALNVFGRAVSFDAQSDPVVRIEAGRMRRALERYYLIAGQKDPVLIDVPKGTYVPVFSRVVPPSQGAEEAAAAAPAPLPVQAPTPPVLRNWLIAGSAALLLACSGYLARGLVRFPVLETAARPASPEKPKLLVLPFRDTSETAEGKIYAAGFADEIINQLSAFKELTVLGHELPRSAGHEPDLSRIRDDLGARYVIKGSVLISAGRARITAQALETSNLAVLWSQTFADDLTTRDLIRMQEEVAKQIAIAVGQPYGIVFRTDAQRTERNVPDDLEAYFCTLRFYGYRAELSSQQHESLRACLERAVARWPNFATAWAMLSHTYLDEDRFGFNAKPDVPAVPRAIEAARKAVSLEPENIRALQSLMLALFFDRRVKEALSVGDRALALNPNDPEFRGEFGSRIAISGDWARGAELLEDALAHNPGNADYYRGVLALSAYMRGDDERAVREIRRANVRNLPLFHVVAAIIYAQGGQAAEAGQARDEFLRLRPAFFEHLETELDKRNFRPEDQAKLIEGARKAGFPVPARLMPTR